MIVQTYVGSIRPEMILHADGGTSWALQWLQLATQAESQGNELVVFEIPKLEMVFSELVMPPDGA